MTLWTAMGGSGGSSSLPMYPENLIPAGKSTIIMDHNFAGGNFGHWRDHIDNRNDGYRAYPPNYLSDWPTDSGSALALSTNFDPRAHNAQTPVPGTNSLPLYSAASSYWNSSRDVVAGQRYLTFMVKYSLRYPREDARANITIGVDTQEWDNSWRIFPRLVGTINTLETTGSSNNWGVRQEGGNVSTLYRGDTVGGQVTPLRYAPMIGQNEEKNNTAWIGLRLDLAANGGEGGYDGVYINGKFWPCRNIGAGLNGAEEPQIASPFAGGLNFAVLLSNGGPGHVMPIELTVLRTLAWTEAS